MESVQILQSECFSRNKMKKRLENETIFIFRVFKLRRETAASLLNKFEHFLTGQHFSKPGILEEKKLVFFKML